MILKIKPQAVIFDWSDTIVGSLCAVYNSFNNILVRKGQSPLSHEEIYNELVASLDEYLPKLVSNKWEIAKKVCSNSYSGKSSVNLAFMPQLLKVIYLLQTKGIPSMIVSNRSGMLLRQELKEAGLEKLFTTIVGVGDTQYCKPSPEPVYLALEENYIDIVNGPVWFVGDTLIDVECAYNSSCIPILLGNNSEVSEFLLKKKENDNPPLSIIADYEELADHIEKF